MKQRSLRALLCTLCFALTTTQALAEDPAAPNLQPAAPVEVPQVPAPPDVAATSYILLDFQTEKVLAERGSDERRPPASLTKIMTSYLAAREIEEGRIKLTDDVPISVHAWKAEGSRMFIQEGRTVKLEDLLKGVIIQSGNDSSIAVAEYIGGSEDAFANMMNQEAAELGLRMTHYTNATGLPDPEHYTTARDLAMLARALIRDYPEHYRLYAQQSFTFNGIEQANRNRLLWRDRTVDGVKTGHTQEAGFCLVASALRDGQRLISVVTGTASDEARMVESQKLLQYGFRYFETDKLYDKGVGLTTAAVWYGKDDEVSLGLAAPVHVTIPRGGYGALRSEMDVARVVRAPFETGAEFGELRVLLGNEVVYRGALIALAPVEEAGFFRRLWHAIYLFFWGLVN
jgi:D-alanyl-D-alanine carboxypeptidase (penicillin-binding protein 5/6)